MSLKRRLLISKGEHIQMSFLSHNTYKQKRILDKNRKERDSLKHHFFTQIQNSSRERTSVCASKGSLTIETALALPVFVLAIVCTVYLFEIVATQMVVKASLHAAGKELAQEVSISSLLLSERLEQKMVNIIGAEKLEQSLIARGSQGIDCGNTRRYGATTVMELSVKYMLKIPLLLFEIPVIAREEKMRIKGWTGYEGHGFFEHGEDMVYITETGMVYHKDAECTYLDLSIRSVKKEIVSTRYERCERCGWRQEGERVYVTDTGEHYHTTLSCPSLRRTVYMVKISEVYGRGGCQRCVR